MEPDNLQKLKDELERLNKNIVDSGKIHLQQTRKAIDENIKDVISIYSNEIRNIAIISGTIAPFSLALLQAEKINASIPILLLGFSLLTINIILAQFFLRQKTDKNDKRLGHAEINWIFASDDLSNIEKDKEGLNDGSAIFGYIKNTDELNNFLELDSRNSYILSTRAELRKQNRIINFVFSAGTLCIILSVIINPILGYLFKLFM